jgi:translocation protein SEC63
MAFEVFDDVAFYWFLLAVLCGFIFPISKSYIAVFKLGRRPVDWTRGLSSCKEKHTRNDQEERKEMMAKATGWRGAMFVCAWVLLIALAGKLTTMQGEEMFSFNPYKILGVEEGAEMSEVKKSYRRLSLKYHPDKNQGNSEANDLFIKVAKAYEVLTDDATRENYEKYGNPDGYHGTSVTIGLPSWLTNKDNELAVGLIPCCCTPRVCHVPASTTTLWPTQLPSILREIACVPHALLDATSLVSRRSSSPTFWS